MNFSFKWKRQEEICFKISWKMTVLITLFSERGKRNLLTVTLAVVQCKYSSVEIYNPHMPGI